MKQKNELSVLEKLTWSLGQSTGRQFITAMVSTYIMIFLTDTFGIGAGVAGIIMTMATIWDAVNDPILGTIADNTKTKWGTYRPYLLFVPLPLSVVATLLFAAPELSSSGKVVYASVLYICYGMLVTCIEIPFNALLPAMTKNEMERNDTLSMSAFIAAVTIMIVTSFTPNLVGILGGDNPSKGYMLVVMIGAICMCITSWLAFAKCKERYTINKPQRENPFRAFAQLLKVKEVYPLIIFWCVGCILFNLIMASSVFYCMYYLMNPGLIASYMLTINISGMVGVTLLMPLLMRWVKGSVKKAVIITQCISAICFLICFFVAGRSIVVIYVFTAIGCAFATMTNVFRPMTIVGMTDYVLETTGKQLNGTLSAIGGFAYKCGVAISNALIAGMLATTGYIAGAIGHQPDAFMVGINSIRFFVPFISTVLYIILIQFYPEKHD